jgi:PKD repeat protein
LLCVLLNVLSPGLTIFSNISVAIIVYLITYYIYKWRFSAFVTKSSKIITQGIGAYFLTWIVALGLFVTILHPAAAFTYSPEFPIVDNEVTFNSASSHSITGCIVSFEWDFGDENTTTLTDSTINHVYATAGNYTVNLVVTNNYGFSTTISDIVSVEAPE